jgi:pimeloyl-ACP methyl ester carboxylesterase
MEVFGDTHMTFGFTENCRGQRVATLTAKPSHGDDGSVLVLAPGFGRRMHHLSVFSRILNNLGATTVRFDLTDHVGASDGDVAGLTMSSIQEDVEAVLAALHAERSGAKVILVAQSLAARASIRALGSAPGSVKGAILLLPVVEVRDTIRRATGSDLFGAYERGEISPDTLIRIAKHEVGTDFGVDAFGGRWLGLETTIQELAAIPIPVFAIGAEHDDWIQVEDFSKVFVQESPGRRAAILKATSHDLDQNLPAMRLVLSMVVSEVETMLGRPATAIETPGLDEIMSVFSEERQWARDGYAAFLHPSTPSRAAGRHKPGHHRQAPTRRLPHADRRL